MSGIKRIIIIDDDPIAIRICGHLIKRNLSDIDACSFTSPLEGLKFIQSEYLANPVKTILLLDINMPMLNGWEVLGKLAYMEEIIKEYFQIYIFSSSISFTDKALSCQHALVTDFIEKPLTKQKLANLISKDNVVCK